MYVNVKGKIWEVANEHVRAGTSEDMKGVEAVHEASQDLQGRFGPDRRGILDYTQDPLPPEQERGYRDEEVEAEGQHRGLYLRLKVLVVEPPETPVPEEILPRQRAMTRETTGEPEAEGAPNVPEPDLGQAVSSAAAITSKPTTRRTSFTTSGCSGPGGPKN